MQQIFTAVMRTSLWLLLVAASLVAWFWLLLVLNSDFSIWTADSNAAGLTLQGALFLFPLGLFFGLKQSEGSAARTIGLFALSWSVGLAALVLFAAL